MSDRLENYKAVARGLTPQALIGEISSLKDKKNLPLATQLRLIAYQDVAQETGITIGKQDIKELDKEVVTAVDEGNVVEEQVLEIRDSRKEGISRLVADMFLNEISNKWTVLGISDKKPEDLKLLEEEFDKLVDKDKGTFAEFMLSPRKGLLFPLPSVTSEFLQENLVKYDASVPITEIQLVNELADKLGLDQEQRWEIIDEVNKNLEEYRMLELTKENPVDEWDEQLINQLKVEAAEPVADDHSEIDGVGMIETKVLGTVEEYWDAKRNPGVTKAELENFNIYRDWQNRIEAEKSKFETAEARSESGTSNVIPNDVIAHRNVSDAFDSVLGRFRGGEITGRETKQRLAKHVERLANLYPGVDFTEFEDRLAGNITGQTFYARLVEHVQENRAAITGGELNSFQKWAARTHSIPEWRRSALENGTEKQTEKSVEIKEDKKDVDGVIDPAVKSMAKELLTEHHGLNRNILASLESAIKKPLYNNNIPELRMQIAARKLALQMAQDRADDQASIEVR